MPHPGGEKKKESIVYMPDTLCKPMLTREMTQRCIFG
jgi:hypothetical protein